MNKIDVDALIALVRAQGHEWLDPVAAERIATGAAAAAAGVAASLRQVAPGLLVEDAGDFAATLEALAGQPE